MVSNMWVLLCSCALLGMSIGILIRSGEGASVRTAVLIFFLAPILIIVTFWKIVASMISKQLGVAKKIKMFFKASFVYWKISPWLAADLSEIIKKADRKHRVKSQTHYVKVEMRKLSQECLSHLNGLVAVN